MWQSQDTMNLKKEIIYNYLSECNLRVGGYWKRHWDNIKDFGIKQKNGKAIYRELENIALFIPA